MSQMHLENVAKDYGSLRVIEDLNLTVEDGSLTVFVGPSGCGKSTLLRMIAGIEAITEGNLLIDGERMNEADPVKRGVSMVFQNYALYPHLSVEKNIAFGLKMANLPKREIKERVAAAASVLKIEDLMKRKPGQLSGGQSQRVAIGRAIVRQPRLFLFDEPLSNLDAELRVAMRIEIAKLHQRLETTMIYVTHDQTEAMTLADKIVVLRDGKIEQQGTPVELFEDPDNLFVAGFIGSPQMNFIDGHAKIEGNVLSVTSRCGGTVILPLPKDPLPASGNVKIGIRPEHAIFGGSGELRIDVTIDVVENLGGRYFVYSQSSSDAQVVFELRQALPPKPGEKMTVEFSGVNIRLFDPNGPRIRLSQVQ